MKKNEIVTLEITGMTSEGSGVGKHEGMAILVPQTAVGDTVEALIIKVAKNYTVGKVSKVLVPSPDRCETDCPVFASCGGCEFRHVSYAGKACVKTYMGLGFEGYRQAILFLKEYLGGKETS